MTNETEKLEADACFSRMEMSVDAEQPPFPAFLEDSWTVRVGRAASEPAKENTER